MTLDELRARRGDLQRQVERHEAENPSPGRRERIGNLRQGIERLDAEIASQEARHAELERLAEEGDPERLETTDPPRRSDSYPVPFRADRESALRLIEDRSGELSAEAADRLDDVVQRDRFGVDARYLRAVSTPEYESAFMKKLAGVGGAEGVLTNREVEAVHRVATIMAERAMGISEGRIGGYAVPFALDPTIILTSPGVSNPLRQLASVVPITTSEWKGVSSEGVEAGFHPEATEAEDDSPELDQPSVKVEKAFCWVPFSIELGEDYGTVQTELRRLMLDTKNTLEAEVFLEGTGTNEPYGILRGATEIVETREAGKLLVDDIYTVVEALPPRFQANATWQTSMATANTIYRSTGPGSEEPSPFNDAGDRLLRKAWYENSVMESRIEGENLVAIYGDIRETYKVVDRIGATVELVPHVFGRENSRPTGQRGLYLYFRLGARVVNKNACRVLEIR